MVLALAAGLSFPVLAAEADAKEVFSVAAAGGMTFSANRVVEDVSLVFMHYTPEGRAALISELERTGLVAEVVGKGAAVRAELPVATLQVTRRAGVDGLDEYDVVGTMRLQWSRCVSPGTSCTPVGLMKDSKVSGKVLQVTVSGRPAYRISSIRYEGAR